MNPHQFLKLYESGTRDFPYIDLSSANLSGVNLNNVNLNGATLRGINLSHANLNDANLCGADLSAAKLNQTNFFGANLRLANLSYTDLVKADLRGANLFFANLTSADFSAVNLFRADLSRANLTNGTKLYNGNLSDTDLSNANLADADLTYADLSRANLIKANLTNADLRYADLRDANLNRANLSHANLSEANLNLSNLAHVKLLKTNLSHADLKDANLAGTDLNEANLSGADLGDKFNNYTANFYTEVSYLANHIRTSSKKIATKEQTKLSLILPLIKLLGYDLYDPSQVVTEYQTVDILNAQNNDITSIDYALLNEKQQPLLIEVKPCPEQLSSFNQELTLYSSSSIEDHVLIITNGTVYKFFANLDNQSQNPFFVFNFLEYYTQDIDFFKLFHCQELDFKSINSHLKLISKNYH